MTGCPQKTRGFTLLELLVATLLVAGLAGSLYATLMGAFKVQRNSEAKVTPSRTASLAMELVAEDLRSAMAPKPTTTTAATATSAVSSYVLAGSFVGYDDRSEHGGDSDDVVFYCTTPSPEPAEGISDVKKVELCCEPGEDGKSQTLVRLITTNLLSPRDLEPKREVLCRGVFGFNLRYYDGTDWLDNWDSTTVGDLLPTAVEVILQLVDPNSTDITVGGYTASQVFLIPCAPPPTGGIQVITSGSSSGTGRTGP
jgi:type II secretion system protein J